VGREGWEQAGKGTVEEYHEIGGVYLGCGDLLGTFLVLLTRRGSQPTEIAVLNFPPPFKMALTAPCGFSSLASNSATQVPMVALLIGAMAQSASYLLGAAAALGSSWCSGLIEKNLWRQGSQRNAGSPRIRPRNAVTPGTCSAEMRCNSRLPQIPQCA
jgi:hypothetical protein